MVLFYSKKNQSYIFRQYQSQKQQILSPNYIARQKNSQIGLQILDIAILFLYLFLNIETVHWKKATNQLEKEGIFILQDDDAQKDQPQECFKKTLEGYKLRFGSFLTLYLPFIKRVMVMSLQPYHFLNVAFTLKVGLENQLSDQTKSNIANYSDLGLDYHYGVINGFLAVIFIFSRIYLFLESLVNLLS